MNYKDKTKEQLINEPEELHQRIEDLKTREPKHNRAELVSNVCLVDRKRSISIQDNNIMSQKMKKHPISILLVEDSPDDVVLFKRLLGKANAFQF